MRDSNETEKAALTASIASGAMIAQQVAGRATRDALFLTSFDASHVPTVMIVGSALSFAAVLVLARALSRWSPSRVVPLSFGLSAGLLVLEWALSLHAPAVAAVALHLHAAIFGATLISAFWSLVNERFDPHSARHLMGRIAGGGTTGGVIGGLFAWRAGRVMGASQMILVVAGLCTLTAWQSHRLGASSVRAPSASAPPSTGPGSAARTLRESSHLRDLALLVGLGAVSGALFDVALSTEAAAAMPERGDLLPFFALFHLSVGLLSFLLQAAAATAALTRLGLAGTVGILPAAVLASTLSIAVAPRLWVAAIVRATEAVVRNSLFRSGYELLYTPLAQHQKRSVKTVIDVGFDRVGTAAGSGLAMLAVSIAPRAALPTLIGLGAVAAAITLLLTPRLHRSYVAALERSLRSGAVSLDPASIIDATTRRTLSGTIDALSRDKILAEIAALRKAGAARAELERAATPPNDADGGSAVGTQSARALAEAPRIATATASARGLSGAIAADTVLSAIADLRSSEPDRVRRALTKELDPALVAHVVPLLAREGLVADAVRALRSAAPRVTGQLLDALLDPTVSVAVRRRIPRVLQSCPTQRAADGLMQALADERFEVRYQCGIALARLMHMRHQSPPITLRREDVIAAAQREIDLDRRVWDVRPPGATKHGDVHPEAPAAERLLVDRTSRSLEHVFRVLSLSLDREPLEIAYRALHAEDPHLRGTALEYLNNVLPESIRARLWPYLGEHPPRAVGDRPAEQALDELLRSAATAPMPALSRPRRSEPRA